MRTASRPRLLQSMRHCHRFRRCFSAPEFATAKHPVRVAVTIHDHRCREPFGVQSPANRHPDRARNHPRPGSHRRQANVPPLRTSQRKSASSAAMKMLRQIPLPHRRPNSTSRPAINVAITRSDAAINRVETWSCEPPSTDVFLIEDSHLDGGWRRVCQGWRSVRRSGTAPAAAEEPILLAATNKRACAARSSPPAKLEGPPALHRRAASRHAWTIRDEPLPTAWW